MLEIPIIGTQRYKHKDGDLYKVTKVDEEYKSSKDMNIILVEYVPLYEEVDEPYYRTLKHFNSSFKKYNKEEE